MENKHKIQKPASTANQATAGHEHCSYRRSLRFWVLISASNTDVAGERGIHREFLFSQSGECRGKGFLFFIIILFYSFWWSNRKHGRLGDLALGCMCSWRGSEIQGQKSAWVPESLTFGWDKTLFFLSLFLSYIFFILFLLLQTLSFLQSWPFFALSLASSNKNYGCCMICICHTDVLSFKLGHHYFTQKDWRYRLCLQICPWYTPCAGICQC